MEDFENNIPELETEIVDESENMQEVAEPALNGENEQEPAEPAEDTLENETQIEDLPEEQPPEIRRQNAALRRQKEEEARRAELKAIERAAQAKIDAAYAEMYKGQANPYTGKPITTEAEYKAYMARYREEKAKEELSNAGLSPEVINTFIENHPAVRRAEDVLEQAEKAKAQAQQALAQEGLANEMKLISALDPTIKSVDDLANMQNAEKFNTLVQSGVALSDAFKLANFDTLVSKSASVAKQSAINSAAGRSHLTATSINGEQGKTIPPETLRMYRELNPGLSDTEYQKHYERMNKE